MLDTLAASSRYLHTRLRITTTAPTMFMDVTDRLQDLIAEAEIVGGLVNIQTLHTTTAIVVNEHEPLLLTDFAALFDQIAPLHGHYHHDNLTTRTVNVAPGERTNGHAHCRALLLAPSACLNIVDGRLQLGRWQRIFLVELDGPQSRDLSVLLLGEPQQ